MPQMSPLSWVTLFSEFCLIFLLVNSINYFSFNYSTKISAAKKIFSKINWKW
uniref:ATP synthase F0 subunit 8 n=1 Tax=Tenebroides mauritanicus TaxID=433272 RepID=UPI0020015DF8|nr:ATP synthase F0 subunit 8 [Tenebroides mauritanicus]UNZ12733.1 ATP synthase F0 subunit 8 [Tenebroides mauritanicus]